MLDVFEYTNGSQYYSNSGNTTSKTAILLLLEKDCFHEFSQTCLRIVPDRRLEMVEAKHQAFACFCVHFLAANGGANKFLHLKTFAH